MTFRVSQVAGALKPADILAKYKRIRRRRESNELPEAVSEKKLELTRPTPCARKLLPIIFQMRQLRITITGLLFGEIRPNGTGAGSAARDFLQGRRRRKCAAFACRLACAEKEIRITAAWNAWHMMEQFWKAKVNSKFKCNIFKATVQGALLSGLLRLGGAKRKPHRQRASYQLAACQNKLAKRLLALTRRNWDTEPKQRQISIKELHRKLGIVAIAMGLRIRRRADSKRRPSHQ